MGWTLARILELGAGGLFVFVAGLFVGGLIVYGLHKQNWRTSREFEGHQFGGLQGSQPQLPSARRTSKTYDHSAFRRVWPRVRQAR
jgi:hypothetical protein